MANGIDPILLGDNPLMGVDHLSQERARLRGVANAKKISELLELAYSMNVKGFVVSTHPQLKEVVEYIINNTDLHKKILFYPIIPYAYGYVREVTENGIIATLNNALSPASMQKKISIVFSGGLSMLKKDIKGLLNAFIDIELLKLNGVKLKCVFLHDVLVDLALALRLKDVFYVFIEHVNDKYGIRTGFVTKNFPLLIERFDEWDIKEQVIMTSFNKVGFQMNPSKEACEEVLKDCKHDVIAMSTLAAGYLNPKEAYEYLFSLPNISSVVVGASRKEHVKETFDLLNNYIKAKLSNI